MPTSSGLTEKRVNAFLDEMHIKHSYVGYPYLMQAIMMVCADKKLRSERRVMPIYELVANRYDTIPTRVERGIRTALKQADCGMTGGQFIFWAADKLYYNADHQKQQEDSS